MLPKVNPTSTKAWTALQQHVEVMKNTHLRDLFHNDAGRFKKYCLCQHEMVFDYSKNIINDTTIQLLLQLAEECKVKDGINAMLNGDLINETEKRSVLHTALRNFSERHYTP